MKIAAFVVACLVATSAVSCAPTTRALTDDFDDFVGLLPLNDLLDLAMRYLLTDKEVQQTLLYLQGEEFSAVWDQFFELSAVRDLLQYLEEAGVPAYESLNVVADFLGLSPLKPTSVRSRKYTHTQYTQCTARKGTCSEGNFAGELCFLVSLAARTGGLNGLLEEALAMMPAAELEAMFEEKMKSSTEFKALFEKMQNFDHKQLRALYEVG